MIAAQSIPLSIVGDVSRAFERDVASTLARVAPSLLTHLAERGCRVVAAASIVEAMPEWAGSSLRGWEPGATWEHADGAYDEHTRAIIVAEWFDDPRAGNRRTHAYRHQSALLHEMGHALDLAEMPQRSAGAAFQAAHTAGLARLADGCPPELEYERQAGLTGAEETFAEAFALLHGASTGWSSQPLYARYFPEVLACVRDAIADAMQAVAA